MSSSTAPFWRSFSPFHQFLACDLIKLEGGECTLRLAPRAEFGNSKGDLHGGIIASILDIGMAQAVRTLQEEGVKVSTITLTINYLAPSRGAATVHGRVVRSGATVSYAECQAINERCEIVAAASGTFRIIRSHLRDHAGKNKDA